MKIYKGGYFGGTEISLEEFKSIVGEELANKLISQVEELHRLYNGTTGFCTVFNDVTYEFVKSN